MFELNVNETRFFTPELFEISLERGGYEFVPGQCAVLFADDDDSRPYSISSGAEEPVLRFLLRRFSGGALSNWLADRRPGDTVRVSLPFGEFRTAESKGAVVFIATGVGISPFLSALHSRGFAPESVRCLYGVRTLEDAVPVPTLRNRVALHLAVSREEAEGRFHGRVTGLLETLRLPDGADYYLCGCDAMIDNVYDLLRARNIPPARIHTEVFFSSEKKPFPNHSEK
jgi:ferredoxin-NADP reductase